MLEDERILVLDGSVGDRLKSFQQVLELGSSTPHKDAFSNVSYANIIYPDLVYKVHESYLTANCDVITTNSFGCTLQALSKANLERYRDEMVLKSCEIAIKAARSAKGRIPWIAGSVGPLGECYQSSKCPNDMSMMEEYANLIRLLDSSDIDIILCETMASLKEALCAAKQARSIAPDKMLWVSFTLDDSLPSEVDPGKHATCVLRSGECLKESIEILVSALGASDIWAILVNCCHLKVADAAVKILGKTLQGSGIRYGVYPNGFMRATTEWILEEYGTSNINDSRCIVSEQSASGSGVYTAQEYADHGERWVQDGATIVGGCCGVGPDHIRALWSRVKCGDKP